MALLAFLGAGYDHYEEKYRLTVEDALRFLVQNQDPNGDLYIPQSDVSDTSAWLYSHAIATMSLCEAYGMTGDNALREPAQKAVDFIVASQNQRLGGWRYSPGRESDTSVTGWMLMALKSAELAGLNVPTSAYEGINQWLDRVRADGTDGSRYVYNSQPTSDPNQAHYSRPSHTMTAVGLLMRLYLGWDRDHPDMIRGARYLLERTPSVGTEEEPLRDTYYWYYATLVMFHMRSEFWQQWNDELHPTLVDHQIERGPFAGSWDPIEPVADRWGHQAGRIYVTAMNLLSLEVYYRHLPLYESTAR
jgi:hypothetical protein